MTDHSGAFPETLREALDLKKIDQEIAQYVAAGGKWLLVTERIPALLRALRATREVLLAFENRHANAGRDLHPCATSNSYKPCGCWECQRARTALAEVYDD